MNMCGLHTETLFNTKFLDIPEFCVNTHTHTLSLTLSLSLSLSKDLLLFLYSAAYMCARLCGLLLFLSRGSP